MTMLLEFLERHRVRHLFRSSHLNCLSSKQSQFSKLVPIKLCFHCLQSTGQQSVTAVLFQGGEKLISSGAVDGQIKIWDLRKTYTNLKQDPVPSHVFPYPGQGVRKHGRFLS